jgi:multiple sugar transport system ATP-binding protein
MTNAVALESVTKSYGSTTVISELNLSVGEGEFVVFVGPSGCGKSTTLRMIAGLEDVSSGKIMIGGRDVTWAHPAERDIAMVFQSYALYPHMTVAENMSFALRLSKVSKPDIDKRVKQAADMLEITPYLNRRPTDLSGGQRQRVAMGRAVVRDAYCFLFDEPLSNLDAKLRATMRTELLLLHKNLQRTMIYVTHDQIEAMTMADRIIILNDGFIQQVGTPKDVYNNPTNTFVATFIGSPAMNLLDADLVDEQGVLSVQGNGFLLPLSGATAERAKKTNGKKIKIGLRPEHFAGREIEAGYAPFDLRVQVAEYIGSSQFLTAEVGGVSVAAAVDVGPDADLLTDGRYFFDTRRLYLFDHSNGQAI